MHAAPAFSVRDIQCFERPVDLRLPFRFGAVTVTHAPQAFVRARIRLPDDREAWGASAELLVPKWFDKDPGLSEAQSFDQLRRTLGLAREAYLGDAGVRTAFGHFAAHHRAIVAAAAREGIPALAAGFGPAELDKAIADALGRALGLPFSTLVGHNLLGLETRHVAPDLDGLDLDAFLRSLAPATSVAVRHTVGMLDAIEGEGRHADDELPQTLEQAIAAHGLRWFKIKLGGRIDADLARLVEIAAVLDDSVPDYAVTLDGNEQYDDVAALAELLRRMHATTALARLGARVRFIEQPVHRRHALERDVHAVAASVPLIIDESDADLDAFPRARTLGYVGVSSKACKGLYKSLLNRARCAAWNGAAGRNTWFMTGEDLTTQAGLAVQQDLALATLLGVTHVERNGHHYVDGFAGQHAPHTEADKFLEAHPDVYVRSHGGVRLRVEDGRVQLHSLHMAGFASAAMPDWSSLAPLATPFISPTLVRTP